MSRSLFGMNGNGLGRVNRSVVVAVVGAAVPPFQPFLVVSPNVNVEVSFFV